MQSLSDLTILVPCYNEDVRNLDKINKFCSFYKVRLLIIDDCSNVPVKGAVRRNRNRGAGNAVKYGVRIAKTKYVAVIDADGQYDIQDIGTMWRNMGDEDMMIGHRQRHRGTFKRFLGRLFLKFLSSIVAGRYIPDLNTGVRIMKRKLAQSYAPIICDEFSYCASYTLAFVLDNYKVTWYPIQFNSRKGTRSTVRELRHGLISVYQILKIGIGLRTRKLRQCLREK